MGGKPIQNKVGQDLFSKFKMTIAKRFVTFSFIQMVNGSIFQVAGDEVIASAVRIEGRELSHTFRSTKLNKISRNIIQTSCFATRQMHDFIF